MPVGRRGAGLITAVAGLFAAASARAQSGREQGGRKKIVYHLKQPGGEDFAFYRQILRNLRNHLSVLPKDGFDLRVVMHGAGLNLLRRGGRADPQIAAAIDELKLASVRFEICRITLRLDNIRLEELYDAEETDLVESGVAQIARLQHQGFAYIKV